MPVPKRQRSVDYRDHFAAAQRQVLAVCVTVRALVLVHVHGTDSEIVVPVVRVLWSDGAQEVLHVFDEQWLVLIDLDRRRGVARENNRYSGLNFRLPKGFDHELRDIDELGSAGRFHVEALRERPQYVTFPEGVTRWIAWNPIRAAKLSYDICASNLADSPVYVSVNFKSDS